jgi:hypothetical protein
MRKNILSLSIATMIGGLGMISSATAGLIIPTTGASISSSASVAAVAAVVNTPATPGAPLIKANASDANTAGLAYVASSNGINAATALSLAPGGIGHQLITPYFTVQGGNATVLSVVNTDPTNGKAVKVRFRSAANSDDILDFQVYMSPSDHWSALISKDPVTGVAQLITNDNTCMLPATAPGSANAFISLRLPTYTTGTELSNLMNEGYVEMFNMADIPKNTATDSFYTAIKHVGGKAPCTAANFAPLATDITSETAASKFGFAAPTTGLFGNWTIINVAQTTTFSGSMTAVRAVDVTGNDGYANYVLFPQTDTVASTSATVEYVTADPLFRNSSALTISSSGVPGAPYVNAATSNVPAAALYYDLPDMSTPYVGGNLVLPLEQAGRITSALAVTSISNEYSTDATVNASTDWTFAMPTRRYSVSVLYGTSASTSTKLYSAVPFYANQGKAVAYTQNTQFFNDTNVSNATDRLCVSVSGQKFFDREESGKSSGFSFSPGNSSTLKLCGEDTVLAFNGKASVLGAALALQGANTGFASGWGTIDTKNPSGGVPLAQGLPVMGSAFIKLINPSVSSGVSGTYGITSDHRFVAPKLVP